MPSDFPTLASLTRQAEELFATRKPLPSEPKALAERCSRLRRYLIESLGYMPPRDAPIRARTEASVLLDGLGVETISYDLDVGGSMRVHVCRPADLPSRAPGVILLHGWDLDKSGLQRATVDLAHAGNVVLSPENLCVRHEHGRCDQCADESPNAVGSTYMGMNTYENTRALDYLCSREDVDAERIACVGVCWSGIQSYVLAALDDRVKAVAAVCGAAAQGTLPTSFAFMQGHMCLGTFLPGFLSIAGIQDLMALVAPRPLLVQNNVSGDWYPVLSFRAARAEVQMVYRTLGYPERFEAHVQTATRDMTPEFTARILEWLRTHV